MKYQNKDGISLNYTQENNVHTDLVKEVINAAISMLNDVDGADRVQETIKFLEENFDLGKENGR